MLNVDLAQFLNIPISKFASLLARTTLSDWHGIECLATLSIPSQLAMTAWRDCRSTCPVRNQPFPSSYFRTFAQRGVPPFAGSQAVDSGRRSEVDADGSYL